MSHILVVVTVLACSLLNVSLPERSCEKGGPGSRPPNARTRKVPKGVWGGQHIVVEVTDLGAKITYDCADGTIDQTMERYNNGHFEVRGTHTRYRGGPARSDDKPDRHQARYTGRVKGNSMTLTVILTDTKETVGTFSLTYGERPELTRCF